MTGIKCDTIAETSNKNVGVNTQVHFDPTWYDKILKVDPLYRTGQYRTEVLWRTLCMDQDLHRNHPAPDIFIDQFRELVCAMICTEGEKAMAEKASVKKLAYTLIRALSDTRVREFVRAVNETGDAPDPSVHGPGFDEVRPSLIALDELARTESGCATPTSLEIEEFRKTSGWRLWEKNGLLRGLKDIEFLRNLGDKYARRRSFRAERNLLGLGSSSVEAGDGI